MRRQQDKPEVSDNLLALGQFVQRCEACGIPWGLFFDPTKAIPVNRFELRVYEGPARAIYRGATATHAASKAQRALDDHRVGWE